MKKISFTIICSILIIITQVTFAQQKPAPPKETPKKKIKEVIIKGYQLQQQGKNVEKGKMVRLTVDKFDNKGRLSESMMSAGADTIAGKEVLYKSEIYEFRYNKKDKLEGVITYNSNGIRTDSSLHMVDNTGWYNYKSSGKPLKKPVVKYDDEGNWIKKTFYDNGNPVRTVERVITYY